MFKKIILTVLWVMLCFMLISPWIDIAVTNHRNAKNAENELKSLKQCELTHKNNAAIKDSLFKSWVLTNDTTIRHMVKTVKTPNISCYGYWKRTGRLECEPKSGGKMICQPESTYVQTDECYVAYYSKDTVWSDGYKSRGHWMAKANDYVNEKMDAAVFHICSAAYPYWNGNKFKGPYKGMWFHLTGMTHNQPMSDASILGWVWVFIAGFGWVVVLFASYPVIARIWRKNLIRNTFNGYSLPFNRNHGN